jgi:hypothetical protein
MDHDSAALDIVFKPEPNTARCGIWNVPAGPPRAAIRSLAQRPRTSCLARLW